MGRQERNPVCRTSVSTTESGRIPLEALLNIGHKAALNSQSLQTCMATIECLSTPRLVHEF